MPNKRRLVVILFIVNLLVVLSPYLTVDRVHNREELEHLQFGFPIAFIKQNQYYYDPPFPYNMKLDNRFGEGGIIEFKLSPFLYSILIANGFGVLLSIGLHRKPRYPPSKAK